MISFWLWLLLVLIGAVLAWVVMIVSVFLFTFFRGMYNIAQNMRDQGDHNDSAK